MTPRQVGPCGAPRARALLRAPWLLPLLSACSFEVPYRPPAGTTFYLAPAEGCL